MPLYEFYCSKCKNKTEELCSSAVKSVRCPSCGKDAEKVLSLFRTGRSSTEGGAASSNCGG